MVSWWNPFAILQEPVPKLGSRRRTTGRSLINDSQTTPVSNNILNTGAYSSHNLQGTSNSTNQHEPFTYPSRPNRSQGVPNANLSTQDTAQLPHTIDQPGLDHDQHISSMDASEQTTVESAKAVDHGIASVSSSATGKPRAWPKNPSISECDSILYCNGIVVDSTGYDMDSVIRKLIKHTILKRSSSLKLLKKGLNEELKKELKRTVQNLDQWGRATEAVVCQFMSSYMFPVHGQEVIPNANSPWSRCALPSKMANNNQQLYDPRPDWYVGYSIGKDSLLKPQEVEIINHDRLRKHVQPGNGNALPFLIVEAKSEATDGSLLKAEIQAAVSGTIAIAAMQRLYEEADKEFTPIDSMIYSLAVSGRLVVLSVHWYAPNKDPKKDLYYMSKVKSFVTSEEDHVQRCHDAVRNIIKWAKTDRLRKVKDCIKAARSKYYPPSVPESNLRSAEPVTVPEQPQDQESENSSAESEESLDKESGNFLSRSEGAQGEESENNLSDVQDLDEENLKNGSSGPEELEDDDPDYDPTEDKCTEDEVGSREQSENESSEGGVYEDKKKMMKKKKIKKKKSVPVLSRKSTPGRRPQLSHSQSAPEPRTAPPVEETPTRGGPRNRQGKIRKS